MFHQGNTEREVGQVGRTRAMTGQSGLKAKERRVQDGDREAGREKPGWLGTLHGQRRLLGAELVGAVFWVF